LPRRFTSQNALGGLLNINFDLDKVVIQSNANQQSYEPKIVNLPEVVYDWNLYGMLLIGLPFEEGEIYRIPYWSQSLESVDYVTATIYGREIIKTLSGKSISTRKVNTNKGLTFWLTKEKPYVIQLELQKPDDSVLLWEML